MLSLLISLSMAFPAHAARPKSSDACRNVAAYQSSLQNYGVATKHLKLCTDNFEALQGALVEWKAANQKSVRNASTTGAGDQSAALTDTAALANAGGATDQGFAQAAASSELKFSAVGKSVAGDINRLDLETAKLLSLDAVSSSQKASFRDVSAAARKDLTSIQAGAQQMAGEAGKYSSQFRGNADQFQKYEAKNRDAADRLNGNNGQDGSGQQQPAPAPAAKSSSKNVLLGIGGGLLITGAAVGGLYFVSQKAIKSANDDGAARIAQAQAAANNVIANAGATATAVITAAQTAAENIIQFASNSVNQVIANASAAANAIYDKAKADINSLKTELTNEVNTEFQSLTTAGLGELQGELSSMFGGLISRAQSEGNATLVTNLQSTLAGLQAQIQNEIARRGTSTGTGSATTTSSGTATSVSTSTGTGTSISTSTSTGTVITVSTDSGVARRPL